MIVKLSCSHSAETPCPGYSVGESMECPECHTYQRILVIERERADQPAPVRDDRSI